MTRTRSLANRLVVEGRVRVDGVRVIDPAKRLRPGNVLTLSLDRAVCVVRVKSLAVRRGPYLEARGLYEDLSEGSDGPVEGLGG